MTHFIKTTDPNRSSDSIRGIWVSMLTWISKKKSLDSTQHIISLNYRTIIGSNGRLKLGYLAMDYQHIVNALHGQRTSLIMHHIGRCYWKTAV